MTDRGPITRCRVKACPFVGHWALHDGLCPTHRDDHVQDPILIDVSLDLDMPTPEGT